MKTLKSISKSLKKNGIPETFFFFKYHHRVQLIVWKPYILYFTRNSGSWVAENRNSWIKIVIFSLLTFPSLNPAIFYASHKIFLSGCCSCSGTLHSKAWKKILILLIFQHRTSRSRWCDLSSDGKLDRNDLIASENEFYYNFWFYSQKLLNCYLM